MLAYQKNTVNYYTVNRCKVTKRNLKIVPPRNEVESAKVTRSLRNNISECLLWFEKQNDN